MTQVTLPELMAALPHILAAPKDDAPIHSLCLRPAYGLRNFPTRITMTRAFIDAPGHPELRLRGILCSVEVDGEVTLSDRLKVLSRP